MKLEGLTEFQEQLLSTAQQTPKAIKKVMNKAGTKLTSNARKKGRTLVKKGEGMSSDGKPKKHYHKGFKKGKVYSNPHGEWVVRALNTAPHAHLIEYGHRQVINPPKVGENYVTNLESNGFKTLSRVVEGKGIGRNVGFVPGKKVMEKTAKEFERSGEFSKVVGDALDDLLERNQLR